MYKKIKHSSAVSSSRVKKNFFSLIFFFACLFTQFHYINSIQMAKWKSRRKFTLRTNGICLEVMSDKLLTSSTFLHDLIFIEIQDKIVLRIFPPSQVHRVKNWHIQHHKTSNWPPKNSTEIFLKIKKLLNFSW